ncbi:hypothetical protein RIF29_10175 [Crotalaria pallida]|uniref:Uncharacterized protein n=1 Tax=Crotalaria pallida TaxID=3830 RepID=A0AAN9FSI4_CROPI
MKSEVQDQRKTGSLSSRSWLSKSLETSKRESPIRIRADVASVFVGATDKSRSSPYRFDEQFKTLTKANGQGKLRHVALH